ncbi:MAG: tryptophanase [Spirochaetia bacterium]
MMHELPRAKTIFEPFRIKSVEPIRLLSAADRRRVLEEAGYNLFKLRSQDVTFDLLTDSGTSAMSARQWAGIMVGDESYAGSPSFQRFEAAVRDLTGLPHVIPTHQGRSAEFLLMQALRLGKGDVVIGNTHFDTTRANIEHSGAQALDLPCKETADTQSVAPFKGNIDLDALARLLENDSRSARLLIITVTNNSVGGQPVSMENIRRARRIVEPLGIPLFLDAARFAENAFFIKKREKGFEGSHVREIAREMFSLCDGALMSAKKDAFGNIGGFLAIRDSGLAESVRSLMVITEGFPTYGGLAGRDLEALAIGLEEILDEDYLIYRLRSTEYFGEGIRSAGIPVIRPIGGHAVYIDAGAALPHIPWREYPGQSLSVALYNGIGIRSVEVGSIMLGSRDPDTGEERPAPRELVRLAIPRRVYTQSHVDYMVEMIGHLAKRLGELRGYAFTYQAPVLRHFTATFKPLA